MIWFLLLQVGPGIVGAGAAVALAARMTGGQKKEDESVWVSSAKLWIKCFDVKTCTKTGCS